MQHDLHVAALQVERGEALPALASQRQEVTQ
jgi:hypothetical protein